MFKQHHLNGNIIDRPKGDLCNDLSVWRFVYICVRGWQSHDYGHTPLSNVWNIGTKVLGTKTE